MARTRHERCSAQNVRPPEATSAVDVEADIRYAPALVLGYHGGLGDPNNCDVEMTILPSPADPDVYHTRFGKPFRNPWPKMAALIAGDGHDITFHKGADDLQLHWDYPIVVGAWHGSSGGASNVTLTNETGLPIILRESSDSCDITTNGDVIDNGSNNTITKT
jgi:hypothetical protein